LTRRFGNRDPPSSASKPIGELALYWAVRKVQNTHTEIEVKLRLTDLRDMLARLKHLGAISHGRVLEQNTLFDTPDSDLRRNGRLIRVRIGTPAPGHGLTGGLPQAVLTAKAPPSAGKPRASKRKPSPFKERAESELTLRNPAAFLRSLPPLGLRPGFRYEKFRTSFRYRGLHLDLDETPVGIILELEGEPQAIDRTAKALGFSPQDYVRATYWDLYAADCRRRGLPLKNMLFNSTKARKSR
jgi:adenylate cyclase class 2